MRVINFLFSFGFIFIIPLASLADCEDDYSTDQIGCQAALGCYWYVDNNPAYNVCSNCNSLTIGNSQYFYQTIHSSGMRIHKIPLHSEGVACVA